MLAPVFATKITESRPAVTNVLNVIEADPIRVVGFTVSLRTHFNGSVNQFPLLTITNAAGTVTYFTTYLFFAGIQVFANSFIADQGLAYRFAFGSSNTIPSITFFLSNVGD